MADHVKREPWGFKVCSGFKQVHWIMGLQSSSPPKSGIGFNPRFRTGIKGTECLIYKQTLDSVPSMLLPGSCPGVCCFGCQLLLGLQRALPETTSRLSVRMFWVFFSFTG